MSAAPEQAECAASSRDARRFQGWRVLSGAFVSQLFSAGLCFNAFGVFLIPVATSFGASRALINTGLSIGLVMMAVVGLLLGRVVDRGPVRGLMVTGLGLLCVGLHLTSHAASLWQAGLSFSVLVAAGAAMTGPIPTVSLVGKWFVRRRGIALGITVAGATVASMAAPAVAAALIEIQGWRAALRTMGSAGVLIGVPLVWSLVIRRPEDVGQRPDGDPVDPTAAPAAIPLPPKTRELLRDPNLWLVSFGFAFLFTSPIVMTNHLVPYAVGLGFDPVRAAIFFATMGPFSLLGKIVFGALVDRVDLRHGLYVAMLILAVTWWLVLSEPGDVGLIVAGASFGMGVGALGPLQGMLIAACFGRFSVGQVMGIGGLVGLPLVAGSGTLVAFLFDLHGSYRFGFLLQLGALAISGLLFALLRIPEVEPGTAPDPVVSPPRGGAAAQAPARIH